MNALEMCECCIIWSWCTLQKEHEVDIHFDLDYNFSVS